MGYLRHECIIVSGWNVKEVFPAHSAACVIFNEAGYGCLVSGLQQHAINGGAAFFVAPDGSKEGWQPSDDCAAARDKLITFLRGTSLDWALVLIGGDDGEYGILSSPASDELPPAAA